MKYTRCYLNLIGSYSFSLIRNVLRFTAVLLRENCHLNSWTAHWTAVQWWVTAAQASIYNCSLARASWTGQIHKTFHVWLNHAYALCCSLESLKRKVLCHSVGPVGILVFFCNPLSSESCSPTCAMRQCRVTAKHNALLAQQGSGLVCKSINSTSQHMSIRSGF